MVVIPLTYCSAGCYTLIVQQAVMPLIVQQAVMPLIVQQVVTTYCSAGASAELQILPCDPGGQHYLPALACT